MSYNNNRQIPSVYTTTSYTAPSSPPRYALQQPVFGSDPKLIYQYQPPQQGSSVQPPYGVVTTPPPTSPQSVYSPDLKDNYQQQEGLSVQPPPGGIVIPPATSQQPQYHQMYPGSPGINQPPYPPVVVVQQQSPIPMQYPQPIYGQQFPTMLLPGGLSSGPGLADCPRCGKRGLTNTNPVSSGTTHLWAALCCFFLCLGCIPYLMSSLKDVEHHCSSCGALISTWRR